MTEEEFLGTSVASDRIRVIFTAHTLDIGGAEKVALDLMGSLDPERFQVFFIVREADQPTGFDHTIRRVQDRGMSVIQKPKRRSIVRAILREYALYRAIRPQIIHLHLPLGFEPFAKKVIARVAGIPFVITTYHQFPVSHSPSSYRPARGLIDRALKRGMDFLTLWGMQKIDDVMIATSAEEMQAHIAVGVPGHKIVVISNGIDLSPYQNPPSRETLAQLKENLGIPPDAFVFGHVGRLNLQKAQRYLVEAATSVLQEFPHAFLVMIGEGEDRAALEAQIAAIGDESTRRRILLPGEVRDTAIASYHFMFDAFVMSSRFEGQGLVNMEAMAAGRPIVATRVGGVSSTVGDEAAILVEPENAQALAVAMRTLASDPALRQRMGQAGRQRAFSRFRLADSAVRHQDLYTRLLEKRGNTRPPRSARATTSKPNLFIIGAMKSGTTSLHRYLGAHPDVFMCEPKEPNYFVEELNWGRGLDWYLQLFHHAGNAAIAGESSTEYAKLPTYTGVAKRIHAFNSEARLIYVMRDPLDRIVSHYWHNVQDLRDEAERRDMLAAVRGDSRYLAYSDYAMQLEPYLDLFGRERIALLTFEQLTADPEGTVAGLCTWLGLEGSIPQDAFSLRWNARPAEARSVRGIGLLNRIRHTSWWRSVQHRVPQRLQDIGVHLAERRIPVSADEEAATMEYLRPILQGRVEALSRLVGREFPEWQTVKGEERRVKGEE